MHSTVKEAMNTGSSTVTNNQLRYHLAFLAERFQLSESRVVVSHLSTKIMYCVRAIPSQLGQDILLFFLLDSALIPRIDG
jgi:hypothetical protein